jgi:tetratricopeptide (TPR) repeat protein
LGQKLFDERAIANGNLYRALQTFREAAWYLETIDPKPENYALAIAGEEESLNMLNEWVADYQFRAERAIKLTNWQEAAKELRAIIEQLPEPSDDRYKKAQRKLLDVERRMNR